MHGYISFDPLRAVFHNNGLDRIDPFKLVRDAIDKHGFLGVKLYPPMGFLPLRNVQHRPAKFAYFIAKALPNVNIRKQLDEALGELYQYCTDNDVPIMAHAALSQASNASYEKFADPLNWDYALQQFGALRLNLAHFGRFNDALDGNYAPTLEWHFGALLEKYPNAKLYADVSFL
jgi:predicted TIM-barrel fold metal-dependent hydrolase